MNNLQLKYLKNFCRKHGLDEQLIDSTLTYGENSGYLKSLVPNFDPEERLKEWGRWRNGMWRTFSSSIIWVASETVPQCLKTRGP